MDGLWTLMDNPIKIDEIGVPLTRHDGRLPSSPSPPSGLSSRSPRAIPRSPQWRARRSLRCCKPPTGRISRAASSLPPIWGGPYHPGETGDHFAKLELGRFFVFFYFFSGGLIGCELIRVYLLIDVDSWIIGCYRLLELIFPNIDKVGTSGIFGRRVWWCLVPLGSLGFTATFTTGDTLYFMSVKLWASSKVVMVPDFLRDLEVAVISKGIELLTVTNPKILMLIGKVVINHWLDVMISQLYQDQLWVISVFLLFDGNEGVSENLKSVNEDSSKSQYIPLDDSMHGAWDYTCSWHCSQS